MSQITPEFRVSALRNGVVVRSSRNFETSEVIRQAAVIEMVNLGFKVNIEELNGISVTGLEQMIEDARKVIGADRNMRPIYPGFPSQVQELSTATLIFEQILHYWTGGEFLPDYADVLRENLPLADMVRRTREVKVLTASETSQKFIRALTTRGIALSDDERSLLEGSVTLSHPTLAEIADVLKVANNGENVQSLILALVMRKIITPTEAVETFVPAAKNVDQVLRVVLAVATTPVEDKEDVYLRAVRHLSNSDAYAMKMVTLPRPARRIIVTRLGALTDGFKADALITRQGLWRRVMRMIHPYGVIAESDVASKRAMDIIHSNFEYKTLNSFVEAAQAEGDVKQVVNLLVDNNQVGNLLRRVIALLRLVTKEDQVKVLADAIRKDALRDNGPRSNVSTIISSYNGIINVNDTMAKVTRMAGRSNVMLAADERKVPQKYVDQVATAVLFSLREALRRKPAPQGVVGIDSVQSMPLVRRDLATTDRIMDRGEKITLVGQGDTIRIFGHWVNTQRSAGYMDIGAYVLDAKFERVEVITWNTWRTGRTWATYSGDKCVSPGDSAAEYIDVNIPGLVKAFPNAEWVAMTIQSYSGFPMNTVDMIAGVMLRSKPNSGEVFDPRTVETAFRPTTTAFQSVPLAFNVVTGEMVWLDSSSGSTRTGMSADGDVTVGSIVYDEFNRPRLTMGQVAVLWAEAHEAETAQTPVDQDAVLALLN